jgi:hypothetical protein
MAMNTTLLLRIAPDALASRLARVDPGANRYRTADGAATLELAPLDDAATLALTSVDFLDEPDEVARNIRRALGDALDAHADKHGVFAFPDKARPAARTYDAVIAEVGELGMWITPASAADAAAPPVPKPVVALAPSGTGANMDADADADDDDGDDDDMAAGAANPLAALMPQLQELMAAIPPEVLGQMQQALASGDPSALAQVSQQLEQTLRAQGNYEQMQQAMLGMFGGEDGADPSGLMGMPGGDPHAWLDQARAELETLRAHDPNAAAQLEAMIAQAERELGAGGGGGKPPPAGSR